MVRVWWSGPAGVAGVGEHATSPVVGEPIGRGCHHGRVADERRRWWVGADRAELERRAAEVDDLAPFLELAREIRLDVARVVDDDSADGAAIAAAIGRIPDDERRRVLADVFDRLPVEAQWAVLERAFGDDEVRRLLADQREERLSSLRRTEAARAAAHAARLDGRLGLDAVAEGVEVVVGLFREDDVGPAVSRGAASSACARQVTLRSAGDGRLRVLDDVFNPGGGYFVTSEYDEQTWRDERLTSHALVTLGSAGADGGLEPALYPAGRVDVEVDDRILVGRLHLGFATLDGIEVFAG